jgi:hypothetical protein
MKPNATGIQTSEDGYAVLFPSEFQRIYRSIADWNRLIGI